MNRGKSSPCLTIQTVSTIADRPAGPCSTDFVLVPVPREAPRCGRIDQCNTQKVLVQVSAVFCAVSEAHEESCLQPPYGVGRRQEIVPNLLDIDDGAFCVRKLHGVFVKSCLPNV